MKKYTVEVFRSNQVARVAETGERIYIGVGNGLFYWRIRMRNRKILADSGEGYKRKSTMMRVLNNLLAGIKANSYEVVEK
jgi:uncharacterized protein YegP (UPF0339 family)